ncbi:MAG: response regulator [Planctomycetota bacterium]|nr:MAG: response regulator [Planctomycetota bacterium]
MSSSTRRTTRYAAAAGRQNTLGAQGRSLEQLLDELDNRAGEGVAGNRTHVRWPFRHKSIPASVIQPDGGEVQLLLACRNLSVGGMSVLHSAYLHPGTRITVVLPLATEGSKRISGRIVRCSHVRGTIHEIGVKFDQLINLREFKKSDPFDAALAFENVDPRDLTGTIVHIDPSQIDRQILRHMLRDSSLSIRGCESVEEAIPHIERGCDLIICEYNLNSSDAATFAVSMQAEGQTQPIIVLSADRTSETASMVRRSPIDVFLSKPVDPQRLFSAIAEFLAPESTRQEQTEQVETSEDMKELASAFAKSLPEYAEKLDEALKQHEAEDALRLATELRGTALTLGFPKVGKAATEVADALAQGASLDSLGRSIRKLITVCRQSRHAA